MTQKNNKIRRAGKDDAKAIAQIEAECFSVPWSEAEITATMSQENSVFLVCEFGGKICGYIGAYFAADEGYITNIAVSEKSRRQGLASAVLQKLKEEGEKLGLAFWTLEVRKTNDGARSLYEKNGFKTVGLRPRFYSNPTEDAVLMTYTYRKEMES